MVATIDLRNGYAVATHVIGNNLPPYSVYIGDDGYGETMFSEANDYALSLF